MTEDDLKDLFVHEQIPDPDDNARKVALNLAVAEFEKNKKNEKISQGNGFFARLTRRQPDQRSEKMAFSRKKMVYGGLATACVALLVYNIVPMSNLAETTRQDAGSLTALKKTDQLMEIASNEAAAPTVATQSAMSGRAKEESMVVAQAERKMVASAQVGSTMADNVNMTAGAPASIAAIPMSAEMDTLSYQQQGFGRDKFKDFEENPIKNVRAEPISTFSIDVDTASYSFARSSLDRGVLPPKDAVRIEELVNYFDYDYPLPNSKEQPFSTNVVMKPSPWGEGKQLMTIGIKGYDIPKTSMPNSNLVFLLDVSGSMNEPNKLPLLKQSISMLLDTLKPTDTISIVVYAGAAGTVLPPTKVADKGTILMALQNLSAGGSTAGAEGIRQAYQLAESNFDKNAVNRVILGTDGDFNVGITNQEELKDFVEREKDKGIFLSVLGFGRGNYNDAMMQILAQNGNGVAAYIDSLNEARKVLVEEATNTLFPIAKDVKIQVEFNPAKVAEYRLVGYETRALKTEDFNNDKVDAGDIGAGAEVTAIYEITPVGGPTSVDQSRYAVPETSGNCETRRVHEDPNNASSPLIEKEICTGNVDHSTPAVNELAFVKVRYKLPNEGTSKLLTTSVMPNTGTENATLKSETDWAVAVASFAEILKGGKYSGKMTYDDVLNLANAAKGADPFGYRAEFITLVHKAKTAAGLEAQPNGQGGGGDGVIIQPYPYPVPMSR